MTTKSANSKIAVTVGVVALLILIFFLGRWTAGSDNGHRHTHDHAAAEVTDAGPPASETIWTCSMHPQVRQPGPGQCPLCGMDLIPAAADDDAEDDAELPRLRVSERAAALMSVQTWPVERREVEREIRLLGRVNPDPARQRTITAWLPGRIDRLLVDIEGASIQRGDPIAEVYSPALISAQEELLQALRTARARNAEDGPMVQAARDRLRLLGMTGEQIGQIEERGRVEDHVTIHSPLDGVIIERVAVEGSYVEAGDRIAALAAFDSVYLDLEAYERDLIWLRQGQEAGFEIPAFPGETFSGQIERVDPFIDETGRTARVRVRVENPEGRLKPGMFARATVKSRLGEPGGMQPWADEPPLVIPATAALITGRRAVVYVKIPDTDRPTFELRDIELGPRAGAHYVVRDGLREGEMVVTHGNFKIDSELQLRGRPSMMAPRGEGAPGHDHGEHDTAPGEGDPREAPERLGFADEVDADFNEEIVELVRGYLRFSEGAAADDKAAARSGVERMRERLTEIGEHRLSGEAHVSWMEHYAALDAVLEAMEAETDLAGWREHLQELTRVTERIYVNFGGGAMPELQRAYCPMVFGDQIGTWLQTETNVYNPYYGAMMLRCGEIISWNDTAGHE